MILHSYHNYELTNLEKCPWIVGYSPPLDTQWVDWNYVVEQVPLWFSCAIVWARLNQHFSALIFIVVIGELERTNVVEGFEWWGRDVVCRLMSDKMHGRAVGGSLCGGT